MDQEITETDKKLISKVVHDLRNDACLILCNLELLEDNNLPGTDKFIDRIKEGAQRIDKVIETLTKIAKS